MPLRAAGTIAGSVSPKIVRLCHFDAAIVTTGNGERDTTQIRARVGNARDNPGIDGDRGGQESR